MRSPRVEKKAVTNIVNTHINRSICLFSNTEHNTEHTPNGPNEHNTGHIPNGPNEHNTEHIANGPNAFFGVKNDVECCKRCDSKNHIYTYLG